MMKLTEGNRRWWILAAMATAISVIFIDITVLPVTLPTMQRDLNFSDIGLQWIVNAYTLALTVFLLAGGRLGDRFGHRTIFFWGQLLFGVGSVFCGLSYFEWWFIVSRLIQGVGGAMLIPNAFALVFGAFPPEKRGKALGIYVSIGSVFLALGPFIGGVFTEYFSWRLVFWINVPILIIGYFLTRYSVPQEKGTESPFDLAGFITSSIGISVFIIGLMQVQNWGWFSPFTVICLVLGVFLLFLLYKLDRKTEDPYIDFSLFKSKTFSGCIFAAFATQFLLVITVFWAMYFQNVLGFTPAQAGTLSLLSNFPIILASPLGGHILDKYGPRLPITIGFSLIIGSLLWFMQILDQKNVPLLLSALIPFGCGIPLIFTPSITTAVAEVSFERRGLASGTMSMGRQFGSTLGLALIGTLFLSLLFKGFSEDLKRNTETFHTNPAEFQGLLSHAPKAVEKLQTLSPEMQTFVKQSLMNAYIDGFFWINGLAILVALLGLAMALLLIQRKTRPELD